MLITVNNMHNISICYLEFSRGCWQYIFLGTWLGIKIKHGVVFFYINQVGHIQQDLKKYKLVKSLSFMFIIKS